LKIGESLAGLIAALLLVAILVLVTVSLPKKETSAEKSTEDRIELLKKLRSVPYTSVTPEKVDVRRSGVVINKQGRAYEGYNIFCSRVAPEMYLMDMKGEIVHRWIYADSATKVWDHAVMLDNGDVLVVDKFKALLKLDWNSNLKWKKAMAVHHDVAIAEDSTLYVFVREPRRYRGLNVSFPVVMHLTPEGELIDRWSTYEHLDELKQALDQRSFLDTILDSMTSEGIWKEVRDKIASLTRADTAETDDAKYDMFHLNTITLLPPTQLATIDTKFRPGNLLLCFRNVNQIAILHEETKKVLWAWGEGSLQWPHHPTMLENGHILIFDNGVERRRSEVVEIDAVTKTIVWKYSADPGERFYTSRMGSAQRLPNGNTLICDGNSGRAFEVTMTGDIVWEWFNPMTQDGHRVRVYRMMRLSPDVVKPLLRS
jgi:hypothetical protein